MRIELWGDSIEKCNNQNKELVEEFINAFQGLKNEVSSIGQYWEGDSYSVFYRGMNDYISQVDQFIADLQNYNTYIERYLSLHQQVNDAYVGKDIPLS